MILSDGDIRNAIEAGEIGIDPAPSPEQFSPSALDLTLGNVFSVWDPRLRTQGTKVILNLAQQDWPLTANAWLTKAAVEKDGSFILPPYEAEPMLLLAKTNEYVTLKRQSKIAARVEGRSSYARLGLTVHLTAPTIHSDFEGTITLEIINVSPFYIQLVPGVRICQLIFERVSSEPEKELQSHFKGQTQPSGAKG